MLCIVKCFEAHHSFCKIMTKLGKCNFFFFLFTLEFLKLIKVLFNNFILLY